MSKGYNYTGSALPNALQTHLANMPSLLIKVEKTAKTETFSCFIKTLKMLYQNDWHYKTLFKHFR